MVVPSFGRECDRDGITTSDIDNFDLIQTFYRRRNSFFSTPAKCELIVASPRIQLIDILQIYNIKCVRTTMKDLMGLLDKSS
jgi:hypothetical protein